jgi:AraC-like DNA-binding protein
VAVSPRFGRERSAVWNADAAGVRPGDETHRLADEVRFEVSQQLLRDTAMSISDIATALHYANPSAFATAFRRWSGTTASQWRGLNSPNT